MYFKKIAGAYLTYCVFFGISHNIRPITVFLKKSFLLKFQISKNENFKMEYNSSVEIVKETCYVFFLQFVIKLDF